MNIMDIEGTDRCEHDEDQVCAMPLFPAIADGVAMYMEGIWVNLCKYKPWLQLTGVLVMALAWLEA